MSPRVPLYDSTFFGSQLEESLAGAREIVPILRDLLHPESVLDVGCGVGTWLEIWESQGVTDLRGVDGPYVDRLFRVRRDYFSPHDLSTPLHLGREFDLVTSFEVAEHLPAEKARLFVDSLVRHGPAIAFSAAIPGQPGLGHKNCQWPSYWAALFAEHGYVAVDAVRPRLWTNPRVAGYYRQNTLLYLDSSRLEPASLGLVISSHLDVVHPSVYSERVLVATWRLLLLRLRSHNIRSRIRSRIAVVRRCSRSSLGRQHPDRPRG